MVEVPIEKLEGKQLLIDGDILRYRCGFAMDKMEAKESELPEFIDITLEAIRKVSPSSRYEIWLSGKQNFREIIAVTRPYKWNRKDRPKPKYYREIGKYLEEEYGATYSRGCEADDELAILLTADREGRVCVSNDKDLRQVSGWHFDPIKGRAYWVSRKSADFALYRQVLEGDSVDGVEGIGGIGPKKSEAILKGAGSSRELCQRAWDAYRSAGLSAAYFEEQFRLVYLLRRYDDYLPESFYVDAKDRLEKVGEGTGGQVATNELQRVPVPMPQGAGD